MQLPHLLGEEESRFHGRLLAVVEITGQQEGVDLLADAKLDDPDKSVPGGIPDQLGKRAITKG